MPGEGHSQADPPAAVVPSPALRRAARWGWLAALVAAIPIAVFAGSRAQPRVQPGPADETPVLRADEALGAAMRSGDKTAVRRLLALQFSFIDADGKLRARKDFLADLKTVASAAAVDAKVRSFGLLAMVTGHRKSAHDTEVFFLDIWAKQKGAWRALAVQEVAIAADDARPAAAPAAFPAQANSYECRNPCQTVPYRVRSPAEQDIINAFQGIERAVVAHDAGEWGKHVADDFVRYGSGRSPIVKAGRIAMIERQAESDAAATEGEVETMRLSVYGDGAVMTTMQAVPDNSRPPYRATGVWMKHNGQWLMAISAQTDIK